MKQYIDATDVAKYIRKMLAGIFPGQKFHVHTERGGGSSIRVTWTDGPTQAEVEEHIGHLHGASFDGMIDMEFHHTHLRLPDGTIVYGGTRGSEGSRGVYPAEDIPDLPYAEVVSLGNSYLFLTRETGPQLRDAVLGGMVHDGVIDYADYTISQWGNPIFNPTDSTRGRGWGRLELEYQYNSRVSEASTYLRPVSVATTTTSTTTTTTATDAGTTIEQVRDWVWLRFAVKPDVSVLDTVRALGGKWSTKRGAWFFTDASVLPDLQALIA